jgi:hypothetical protein
MTAHSRGSAGDAHAAGRGRQRLKLAAIGYNSSRHGVDADAALARAAKDLLCKTALEFVEALPGEMLKNRRVDLYRQADSETLQLVAIAYACARHGVDADVGMAREGLNVLCQASIDFVEALPRVEAPAPKRSAAVLHLGNGVTP